MSTKSKQKNKASIRNSVSIAWSEKAWEDYISWANQDLGIFQKINDLVNECRRTPFTGTGKPEPLKGDLSGSWSRRITHEHRLVYMFEGGILTISQCKYHY